VNLTALTLAAGAASLVLVSASSAQSVRFDGLLNSPLGSSSLSVNVDEHLVISNIGSSGLDGVSIDLGESQGSRVWPLTQLAANESCVLTSNAVVTGSSVPAPLSLTMTVEPNGTETIFLPDYSSIGQLTYTLRVYKDGVVVYEQGGHTGGTKMHNNPHADTLPQLVYMLTGINGLPFLECVPWEGGSVTPPGGGTPIACDLVEFFTPTGPVIGIDSVDVLIDGPQEFLLATEEVHTLDHFVTGMADVHLDAQTGRLKISNLGSSGCDGVSIDLGGGDNLGECQLEELAAPNHPNGTCWLESTDSADQLDSVQVQEVGGRWEYTPDFSVLGASTYTLELHLQGQIVFSQAGMSGPAVKNTSFTSFYKKKLKSSDGTTEAEWCIGGAAASPHTVSGGPTIIADMFIVRSKGNTVLDDEVRTLILRAADASQDLFLLGISSSSPPCVGTSYCTAAPNSTGVGAPLCASGSSSVADNDLVLTCTSMPVNMPGLFFYGPNQISIPFGNGFRCVGGGIYRLGVRFSGAAGIASLAVDNTSPPAPAGQISPGQVWAFQCWYRDPAAGGAEFNLSDGQWILFTP